MYASVAHVALRVANINWYTQFFENVFNMRVVDVDGELAEPQQVWLDAGLQLISDTESSYSGRYLDHIAIEALNREDVIAQMLEYGITQLPRGREWFRLPDGLCLEIL